MKQDALGRGWQSLVVKITMHTVLLLGPSFHEVG